jgi:DNA primase
MNLIPESDITQIKNSVSLISLCHSRNIPLKKTGKNYLGNCPFHDDDKASFTVNPKENLFHCFGCNTGGDVIRFVELLDKCTFPEAVATLSNKAIKSAVKEENNHSFPSRDQCPQSISPLNRNRLLSLVTDFYHAAFNQRKDGKDYLAKRGITDPALLSHFKAGFCAGSIRESIPKDGKMPADLKTLGVITQDDREFFKGCVVFPIPDITGQVVNLYGRRIRDGQVNHLYLPGPKAGIFNGAAIKTADIVILVESILDALALIQAGYPGAIPCYGSSGIPDQILETIKQHCSKPVYLCFDADDAGRSAAMKASLQLEGIGISAITKILPDLHDPCSLLLEKEGKHILRRIFRRSEGTLMGETQASFQIFNEKDAVRAVFSERTYLIKGISPDPDSCRAIIKVTANTDSDKFHLDKVDLYSSKIRSLFARSVAEIFGVRDAQVATELLAMVEPVEKAKKNNPAETETDKPLEMTDEEKQEALSLLTASNLFDRILMDFESIGITGEETNKLVGYLAAVSRKIDEPISVCFQSRSSAGKSALQDAILNFVPPEDLVRYTRLTGQALFYKGKDSLKHKILAIEEDIGAKDASYSIRTMQSSKSISVAVTVRDPQSGKQQTDEHRVDGPTAVFTTTTNPEPDQETASRQVIMTVDESSDATAKILEAQRTMDTLEGVIMRDQSEQIIQRHRNAQRLLEDGLKVVNPYSKELTYPVQNLQARRDQKKYLSLIKTIAYLRQYQREIKTYHVNGKASRYVEVFPDDIRLANRLAMDVLGHSLDELSPPSRRLLEIIREYVLTQSTGLGVDPKEYQFSRRDIREHAGWPDHQVKRYIKQLIDLEYLYAVTGKKGQSYIYELRYGDEVKPGKKFLSCLVDVDNLENKSKG